MTLAETAPSVDRGLDLIAETAGRVLGADHIALLFAETDGTWATRAAWGAPAPDAGVAARVFARGQTLVERIDEEPAGLEELPPGLAGRGHTVLGAPIGAEGRTAGVLVVVWKRDLAVGASQRQLAEALAHHAATVLENARVLDRERTLRELTQALAAHLDERTVLELAIQHAARLLSAPFARVWLLEPDGSLTRAAAEGFVELLPGPTRAPAHSVAARVARHGLLNMSDASQHPAWIDRRVFEQSRLRAYLGAPIRRAGEPLGVLALMREVERPFGPADEALLTAIADAAAVAVANARVYRAAQASEARYREVFEESKDPLFITTTDGRFVDLNPAGMELFGIASREELLRTTVLDLYDDPAERERVVQAVAADGFARDCEVGLHKRTGEPLRVLVTATAVRDADGNLVGYRGSLRDVTATRRSESALRDAEERAQQAAKLRALGQMASGIAHDLNQALGLVVGHGELALRQLEQPRPWVGAPPNPEGGMEAARDSLRVMVKAAMDGAETVKRLLAFSRAQPEGQAERVDLGLLLADAAKLTAPHWRDDAQAQGRRIALDVETTGDTTVAGWPASLRETLANLIFNAVDALPQGGNIRLSARRAGAYVVAEVTDDGVGMPPEVQARVFEPFFTTKGEKGTGLGLAVVFGIVERHGGTIGLDSRTTGPLRGTTFRIVLPAATPAAAPVAAASEQPATETRLRILAVDDEPELREMIALMLTNDGHDVRLAAGGDEALEALAAGDFDVVISDVGMPGMTGWELADRARERWPGLRIVLATGWGAEIDPAEARQRGIEAVIAKPFRFNDLRRVLISTGST